MGYKYKYFLIYKLKYFKKIYISPIVVIMGYISALHFLFLLYETNIPIIKINTQNEINIIIKVKIIPKKIRRKHWKHSFIFKLSSLFLL